MKNRVDILLVWV